ncbi:MAG: histidine kinase [Clostridiales bacterium]|nr:histidine kinase [Clostridiales bacterium]
MIKKVKELCFRYGITVRIVLLYVVLVIIPFLVLVLFVAKVSWNYAMTTLSDNTMDAMSVVEHEISYRIDNYEEQSMYIYYNGAVEMLSNDKELSEEEVNLLQNSLSGCCESDSSIHSACVTTGNQVIYSNTKYQALVDIMASHEEEIIAANGRCLWYATNELYGNDTENNYILARSLNSAAEKNVGILYLVIDDSMITDAFNQMNSENALKYLLNQDGTVMYCTDESLFGTVWDLSLIGNGEDISGKEISLEGKKALVTATCVETTGWYCAYTIYQSEIMQSFSNLTMLFIAIPVIYILFLLSMLFMLKKYIFHPLGILKNSMDQYARDGLEVVDLENIGVGELRSLSKHFNHMTMRINNLMTAYKEKTDEINRQKMEMLASQLTPHFIYNALNTIKWVAVLNHQEKIQKLVESLVYIFMSAAHTEDANYSVKDELELIENYAVLQKARFMNFDLIIDAEEDCLDCRLRKLLLQPVVENAIIHGLARGSVRNSEIKIRVWMDDDLHIIVTDQGVGFDVQTWREKQPEVAEYTEHTNIGLHHVEQVIALEYGEPYHMEIYSEPGKGTEIRYFLPALQSRVSEGGEDNDSSSTGG